MKLKLSCGCAALVVLVIASWAAPATAMFEVQWFPADGSACEYAVRWDFRYDNGTTYDDTLFRVYNDTSSFPEPGEIRIYAEEAEAHIDAIKVDPGLILLAEHAPITIKNTYSDASNGNLTRHFTVTAGNLTFDDKTTSFIITTVSGHQYFIPDPTDNLVPMGSFITNNDTRFLDYINASLSTGDPVIICLYNGSYAFWIPRVTERTSDSIIAIANYTIQIPEDFFQESFYVADFSGQVSQFKYTRHNVTDEIAKVSYTFSRSTSPPRDFTLIITTIIAGGIAAGVVIAVMVTKRRRTRTGPITPRL
nr:hypothetical protein [Candidatus Sigynarchaeota archaeon]